MCEMALLYGWNKTTNGESFDIGDGNIRNSPENVELGSIGELSAVASDKPDDDSNESL